MAFYWYRFGFVSSGAFPDNVCSVFALIHISSALYTLSYCYRHYVIFKTKQQFLHCSSSWVSTVNIKKHFLQSVRNKISCSYPRSDVIILCKISTNAIYVNNISFTLSHSQNISALKGHPQGVSIY